MPRLSQLSETLVGRIAGIFGVNNAKNGNGFTSGFVTGLSLGIVWAPCAGPILAAIAVLAATGKVSLTVVAVTFFYVLGAGIPLFLFSYGGQQLIVKTKFISRHLLQIQQVFGILMILAALAIYTNYDQYLQVKILNAFPQLNAAGNIFGSNKDLQKQLNALKGAQNMETSSLTNNGLFNTGYTAPDFNGGTKWLNTGRPLTINSLKGKVVLVDFWTYTCINCIRTLPYVTAWYDKYKSQGFIVIGVHTPEFEFEKNTDNLLSAIKRHNIHYPVVQDNSYKIWNSYNNQYWPAEYLIDANGQIRRTHFGEGEYDRMEEAIQILLKDAGKKVSSGFINMPDQTPQGEISPETYLGSSRMQYYYPDGNINNGLKNFSLASNLSVDSFSLGGQWNITNEAAITGANSTLNYNFTADKVFLVLVPGSVKSNSKVKVYVDGKLADKNNAGSDVVNGTITINSDRLYNLVDLKGKPGNHILKLEFESPGIQVFAFTFG